MMTPSLTPRCAQSPAISLGPIFPTMLKSMRFAQHAHSQDHRVEETRRRNPVKYAISDAAWLDPSPCPKTSPNAWSTEESTPCALSTKIEPDSRGSSPGMTSRVPPHNTQLLSFTFSASRYTFLPISLNLALIFDLP